MVIKAIFLDNVSDINNFTEKNQIELFEGQISSIYIMLKNISGIRYIPQGVFSLSVNFPSIDAAQNTDVAGTQPFADDKSIFKISIPASLRPKTGTIVVTLTEDGVDKKFLVDQGIVVHLLNPGSN